MAKFCHLLQRWLWFLERAKSLVNRGSPYCTVWGSKKYPTAEAWLGRDEGDLLGMLTSATRDMRDFPRVALGKRVQPQKHRGKPQSSECLFTFWCDFSKISLTRYSCGTQDALAREGHVYVISDDCVRLQRLLKSLSLLKLWPLIPSLRNTSHSTGVLGRPSRSWWAGHPGWTAFSNLLLFLRSLVSHLSAGVAIWPFWRTLSLGTCPPPKPWKWLPALQDLGHQECHL